MASPAVDETLRELLRLRHLLGPEADRGWVLRVARTICELELGGWTHFGGPEVLAWWLLRMATGYGWGRLRITSYLSQLKSQRIPEDYTGRGVLRHQCGWCGWMIDDLGPLREGEQITTGICPACRAEQAAK